MQHVVSADFRLHSLVPRQDLLPPVLFFCTSQPSIHYVEHPAPFHSCSYSFPLSIPRQTGKHNLHPEQSHSSGSTVYDPDVEDLRDSLESQLVLTSFADDYAALEPAISGQIMELHHSKHHNTYVTSLNAAFEKLATAQQLNTPESIAQQIALQPVINFHGGGHINHSLFWENLAPKGKGGGEPPSGKLGELIDSTYGGLDNLKKVINTKLAGIQGSGWAWLVKNNETGNIEVKTYAVSSPLCFSIMSSLGIEYLPRTESRPCRRSIHSTIGDRCLGTRLLPPIPEQKG